MDNLITDSRFLLDCCIMALHHETLHTTSILAFAFKSAISSDVTFNQCLQRQLLSMLGAFPFDKPPPPWPFSQQSQQEPHGPKSRHRMMMMVGRITMYSNSPYCKDFPTLRVYKVSRNLGTFPAYKAPGPKII